MIHCEKEEEPEAAGVALLSGSKVTGEWQGSSGGKDSP